MIAVDSIDPHRTSGDAGAIPGRSPEHFGGENAKNAVCMEGSNGLPTVYIGPEIGPGTFATKSCTRNSVDTGPDFKSNGTRDTTEVVANRISYANGIGERVHLAKSFKREEI